MALEDAVVLAKAIAEAPDAPSAFARYEVARVARTTRVVLASRRQGRTQVTRSRATMLRRDLSFRLFDRLQNPGRGDPPFVRWLFGWEP